MKRIYNQEQIQELPDELVNEVSMLYDMGLELYEINYLIQLRNLKRI